MLKIKITKKFKRDFELSVKRGFEIKKLEFIITILSNNKKLPSEFKDHILVNSKEFKNCRECHITPDWLLVYQIDESLLTLKLIRTGTHSDLFSNDGFTYINN